MNSVLHQSPRKESSRLRRAREAVFWPSSPRGTFIATSPRTPVTSLIAALAVTCIVVITSAGAGAIGVRLAVIGIVSAIISGSATALIMHRERQRTN